MKREDKQIIIDTIADFENGLVELHSHEAADSMMGLITILLGAEGYNVSRESEGIDNGIDFWATKGSERIAIQYSTFMRQVDEHDDIAKLFQAVAAYKHNKIIILTGESFSAAQIEAIKKIAPASLELFDLDGLKKWVSSIEANYDDSEIVQVLKDYLSSLIELIAKSSTVLAEIEWRDIERLVAEVFNGLGFDTVLTPSSKDGGKDIILECIARGTKKSYIVEIKHWRSGQPVGERKVREFLQVIAKEKRDGGLFLSTYGFVDNAVESLTQIDREKVRLGTETKIATLCKTYMKKRSGLWQDEHDLPVVLFEDTI